MVKRGKAQQEQYATIYDIARVFALHEEKIFSLAMLMQACGYKKNAKQYIEPLLVSLETYGVIEYKHGYALSPHALQYTGRLVLTRGGGAFCVLPEHEDVFIPVEARYGAHENDIVNVLVIMPATKQKKAQGCVIAICSKAQQYIPARAIQKLSYTSFLFESLHASNPMRFIVHFEDEHAIPYTIFRLVYTVSKGEEERKGIWHGTLVECLGIEEQATTQERIIQVLYELPRTFPADVVDEVAHLPHRIDAKAYGERKDMQALPFVTIDGEDSRDFDDAICVEAKEHGYILYVAIADVTAYVYEGTAIDREARSRSNSYYFPTMVLPMLPEALSNGICSLCPNEARLAIIVEIHCDVQGIVTEYTVYEGIIRSHGRLTYTQVQHYFDSVDGHIHKEDIHIVKDNTKDAIDSNNNTMYNGHIPPSPLTEEIQGMLLHARALTKVLYHARYTRGALFFESVTPYFTIHENKVTKVQPYPRYYAHQLIEECMLLANECVATLLTEHGYPVVYRTHTAPSEEKLEALRTYARYCFPGERIPRVYTPHFLHALLTIVKGTPQEHTFHNVAIRSMMQARYSLIQEEHYGLQSQCYCHFTSPIRRYADCLVHRIVKAYLYHQQISQEMIGEMKQTIELLNKHERIAMNAERDVHKRLGVLYMKQFVGTEQKAVISGIHSHAIYIDFPDYGISGIVLLSSLHDDYYEVIESQQRIQGRRTKQIYALGEHIRVQVLRVSLTDMEIQCSIQKKEIQSHRSRKPLHKRKQKLRQQTSHRSSRKQGRVRSRKS